MGSRAGRAKGKGWKLGSQPSFDRRTTPPKEDEKIPKKFPMVFRPASRQSRVGSRLAPSQQLGKIEFIVKQGTSLSMQAANFHIPCGVTSLALQPERGV